MAHVGGRGHVLALITVFVWGITFVSTKVLLEGCSPAEILVLRFSVGFVALLAIRPKRMKVAGWRDEGLFCAAGATGVAGYFLLENIALSYTTASNVGVIVAVSPLLTGLIAGLVLKKTVLRANFFIGFVIALSGIALIGFSGSSIDTGLVGCALALLAALVWAVYSNVSKRISEHGFDTLLATRRTFFWGLVWMLPFMPVLGFSPDWSFIFQPVMLGNLLFLGLGASALCYVMWNTAVDLLGPVKSTAYIYLIPVVTIVTAMIVLSEQLTGAIAVGVGLTVVGLIVSERDGSKKSATRPSSSRLEAVASVPSGGEKRQGNRADTPSSLVAPSRAGGEKLDVKPETSSNASSFERSCSQKVVAAQVEGDDCAD